MNTLTNLGYHITYDDIKRISRENPNGINILLKNKCEIYIKNDRQAECIENEYEAIKATKGLAFTDFMDGLSKLGLKVPFSEIVRFSSDFNGGVIIALHCGDNIHIYDPELSQELKVEYDLKCDNMRRKGKIPPDEAIRILKEHGIDGEFTKYMTDFIEYYKLTEHYRWDSTTSEPNAFTCGMVNIKFSEITRVDDTGELIKIQYTRSKNFRFDDKEADIFRIMFGVWADTHLEKTETSLIPNTSLIWTTSKVLRYLRK